MTFDPIAPIRLGTFPLWHLPIPTQRYMLGDHPSTIHGFGEEIVEIREMEPGDGSEWYSPIVSARMKKRMAVFHTRNEEVGVQFFLDAGPAMDFGSPSKRHVAVKIMSSLAANIFCEPNQGTATFIGVGARTICMPELGDQAVAASALRRFAFNLPVYGTEALPLPKALKLYTADTPEQLVCVFSDFLIEPRNERAWESLETAYKRCGRQGSEVLLIRVLSPLECSLPNNAITVRSGGNAYWSGWGTNRELQITQDTIRERLSTLCSKPNLRFLEIVWDGDEDRVTRELQELLHARTRHLRTHLDVAPA